jgi:type IV secretory pathway VirB2 component (pilin)
MLMRIRTVSCSLVLAMLAVVLPAAAQEAPAGTDTSAQLRQVQQTLRGTAQDHDALMKKIDDVLWHFTVGLKPRL